MRGRGRTSRAAVSPASLIDGFPNFGKIELKSLENTRDLGGMPTEDGRKIRSHCLIRSGSPHAALPEDLAVLTDEYKISVVFDLRTQAEIDDDPCEILSLPGVTYRHESVLPEDYVLIAAMLGELKDYRTLAKLGRHARKYMQEMYASYILSEQAQATYSRFLQTVLELEDGAILWHCTQGKDRCGFGAVLVEYALGVSRENIYKDYRATDIFMRAWVAAYKKRIASKGQIIRRLVDWNALFYTSPMFLDSAFETAQNQYGSFDAFLDEALDFGPDKRDALRAKYLE